MYIIMYTVLFIIFSVAACMPYYIPLNHQFFALFSILYELQTIICCTIIISVLCIIIIIITAEKVIHTYVVNFTNTKVVKLIVGDHHHPNCSEPCGKVFTTFC